MNSFILILLLLLNVAIGFSIIYSYEPKILLSISGGFLLPITEYMMLALFGAYFSFYSAIAFMLIEFVVNLLIALLNYKRIVAAFKSFKKPELIPAPYIIALVLSMCSVIFVNGFYGMGQDEGVYQVKALALSEGEQSNVIYLDEETEYLRALEVFDEDQEFRAYSDSFFYSQTGFYKYGRGVDGTSLEAIFHGTVSYPSLLAFDIEAFGLTGTMNINYVLVFMSFVFLMEIVNMLDLSKFAGTIVLLIGMLSPTTIWTNKSSLTESVLFMYIVALTCGLMLASKKNRIGLFITVVSAFGVSVLHLSAFYLLPIIGILLIISYLRTDDWFAILCSEIITVVYLMSFYVQSKLYYEYMYGNLTFMINKMFTKQFAHETCVKLIMMIAMALGICTLLFLIPFVRKLTKKVINSILYPLVLIMVGVFCALKCGKYILSYSRQVDLIHAFSSLTLFGMNLSSGLIILPLAIILGIIFSRKIMRNPSQEIVLIMFVYYVIFLGTVIHGTIPHYYYYSRYFSTYVFYIPLVFALIVDKYFSKKVLKCAGFAVATAGFLVILPYSLFVSSLRDDTFMKYSQFEEYSSIFEDGDAVVFSDSAKKVLLLPTKFTTDADVYSMSLLEERLLDDYSNVYHVCYAADEYTEGELYKEFEVDVSNDPQYPHKYFFPLFDFERTKTSIKVYKLDKSRFENTVTYSPKDMALDGFNVSEPDMTWSGRNTCSATFYVGDISEGTTAHITFASSANLITVPQEIRNQIIKISVNDIVYYEDVLNNLTDDIVVNACDLKANGYNTIDFEFDTWTPIDYYPAVGDTRNLGFAFTGVTIR